MIRIISRGLCSSAAAVHKEMPVWNLYGAVCAQRVAIITADLTPEQQALQDYLSNVQEKQSVMSDFEFIQKEDSRIEELRKTEDYDESEIDQNRKSAYELEKTWEKQTQGVTLSSRLTADDESNNLKSADRLLHRPLTLLVKQRYGDQYNWTFPQTAWRPGESMRQTGERALKELCGLEGHFLGNAPIGYYKYKYPQGVQEERQAFGAKVFVFKAQLLTRDVTVSPSSDVQEYMWLSKEAITDTYIPDPHILQRSKQCIMEL